MKNSTYFNQTQVLMLHHEGSLGKKKQNKTSLPIFLCSASSASTFWIPVPTLGTSPFNLRHIDLSWRIWLWPVSFKACEQNVCYFFLWSFILRKLPRLRLLPAPNAKGKDPLLSFADSKERNTMLGMSDKPVSTLPSSATSLYLPQRLDETPACVLGKYLQNK